MGANPLPKEAGPRKPNKAIVAGFAGAISTLTTLAVAVTHGSDAGSAISTGEWINVAIVLLTSVGGTLGVYQVSNPPKE